MFYMIFFYMKEELLLTNSSPLIQPYTLHRKCMWPLTQDYMILFYIYIRFSVKITHDLSPGL